MSTALKSVELGVAQQALVTGQVIDAVTGSGVTPDSLFLEMRFPGETEYRMVRASLRLGSAGYFSFSGAARRVFPQSLDPTAEVELRFNVSARFYTALQTSVLVAAETIIAPVSIAELGNHELELRVISAPVVHAVLTLAPTPVGISGLVIGDHDLNSPLEGASIQVIEPIVQPAVLSNSQGRFRINALPLAQTITLQVELGDVSTKINHVIDYTTPFNTRIISLNG